MALACLVDWDSVLFRVNWDDIHGIGIPGYAILGQSWILDTLQGRLGQCGILSSGWTGMDTHWISMALAVDCDPGQSPFKADWDSVGQCEMDWDNAYPWIFMALASLGRLGQRGILGQSSILDNLQGRLGQCGLGQDWDNGCPLDIHGIGIPG